MRLLYVFLMHLAAPLYLLTRWVQGLRHPQYRGGLAERLGGVARPAQAPAAWVHAVSVGETMAALPLIRALVARHGQGRVWVTSGTATGRECVRTQLGSQVLHSYAPLDLPWATGRFLDRIRPTQVIIIETEIWPCLYQALWNRQIPLLIFNARLSERSMRGYRRFASAMRQVLSCVQTVAAQSERDAEHFRELGAPRVVCAGNIKFDAELDPAQLRAGAALRQTLGTGRPVWIAASTHPGEETAALAAHRRLLQALPDALLILVPRHPQRFDEVATELDRSGLPYSRRSIGVMPGAAVLLGDSMGEMPCYLAAADLAFVGGSLVPVGGHNILEPALAGLPVLFGPHMGHALAARELLLQAGAAEEVLQADALAEPVIRLLQDSAERRRRGDAGRAAVERNRGTLKRLLNLLPA